MRCHPCRQLLITGQQLALDTCAQASSIAQVLNSVCEKKEKEENEEEEKEGEEEEEDEEESSMPLELHRYRV